MDINSNETLKKENRILKEKIESLLETRTLWEFALDGADLGTWTYDIQTDLITIDRNSEAILGFKPNTNSEWDAIGMFNADRSEKYNFVRGVFTSRN